VTAILVYFLYSVGNLLENAQFLSSELCVCVCFAVSTSMEIEKTPGKKESVY
jgi:hypothetical protein